MILDRHRLTPQLRQLLGEGACEDINPAAGAKRLNQTDRPRRIVRHDRHSRRIILHRALPKADERCCRVSVRCRPHLVQPGERTVGPGGGSNQLIELTPFGGRGAQELFAVAVDDLLGREAPGADYRALPRVTFTEPDVGSAGLTEAAARERGLNVRTGNSVVAHSARGWIHGPGDAGFIKLVEDADRGLLVGATSVGPVGGEVLSMLQLAVQAQVRTDQLRRMIYAYPTFYRGIEDALRDLAV
ncbi:MAG: hypothetical protein DLM67_15710 [Candidatus Nephthysia bennettiae]|uniref:NAD(P)/FAD-dependent oxidoreductase n=1 Tax=Candidatus Nephthysia bennettiae TaxID=3127016 RepID=A0A934K454_9BACT|nr:NAD(P)/FAD-dependent oxidoreductase [Candidatus Dormibacteraeota bacterium]MBJ7611371.1 NAD(P)/FAD-dependent oxidoreductase [Candidatus Dormibacteraeota bacterium]PZR91856.1 MAG: hypothetical protein DLM67_15710 [Candidatus Dormibacteraeota bacterium]